MEERIRQLKEILKKREENKDRLIERHIRFRLSNPLMRELEDSSPEAEPVEEHPCQNRSHRRRINAFLGNFGYLLLGSSVLWAESLTRTAILGNLTHFHCLFAFFAFFAIPSMLSSSFFPPAIPFQLIIPFQSSGSGCLFVIPVNSTQNTAGFLTGQRKGINDNAAARL